MKNYMPIVFECKSLGRTGEIVTYRVSNVIYTLLHLFDLKTFNGRIILLDKISNFFPSSTNYKTIL